jgi:hypothetical protein
MKKYIAYIVEAAREGNRDAAIEILKEITWYVKNKKVVPKEYRDYLTECVSKIDDYKVDYAKIFNLKKSGKGDRLKYDLLKRHLKMQVYINSFREGDVVETSIYKKAAERFHYEDYREVKKIYNKYFNILESSPDSKEAHAYRTFYAIRMLRGKRKNQ